jgi:diaminopimelate decarboxylase
VLTQSAKARRLAARLGSQRDGVFAVGEVPVSAIAQRHGTPFYLYSGEALVERVRTTHDTLGTELFYSLKANPSLAVSQLVARQSVGAEVASAGELLVALEAGFAPLDIVFAGPGKSDDDLERLVEAGIYADHVESLTEIDRLASIARRRGTTVGVGLRINPQAQLMGSLMRMGGTASQFGIDEGDLPAAVERTLSHSELKLHGIHVYTATQVFDPDSLVEYSRGVLDIARRTADLAGQPLEMIDFGGGFGVPYFDNTTDFDLPRFAAGLRPLLAEQRADRRLADCRFAFELGRYLVAEAGVYVMRVIDVKTIRDKTFVVTDGGMNHHLTATGNMGQVFRKAYPLLNLSRLDEETAERVAVVGPLCTPLDSFGSDIELAGTRIGDLIGVFYSGAYGFSASNLRFLSHPSPAEVLVWQGQAHGLRSRGQPEDVLAGQQPLAAD